MKGIVFTEFLDMVDEKFGFETTETIVGKADLPSGGAYTSVGTYSHGEMLSLVTELSRETKVDITALVKVFGEHLLARFRDMFPEFFDTVPDLFSFLENVDGYIHGEVRKLYPNATLPEIDTVRHDDGRFEMTYKSKRKMADLAEGLIGGAMTHFGGDYALTRTDMPEEDGKQCVVFALSPLN